MFASYGSFGRVFSKSGGAATPVASTPGAADDAPPAPDADTEAPTPWDPVGGHTEGLCKTGAAVLNFPCDVFAGSFDKDLNEFLKKEEAKSVGGLNWVELGGALGVAWREVARQLGVHKQIVSASSFGQLPLGAPVVIEDEAEDASRSAQMRQERKETWNKAQTGRWKHAAVSHSGARTVEDLQKWFEGQRTAYLFVGKFGKSHREEGKHYAPLILTASPSGNTPAKLHKKL